MKKTQVAIVGAGRIARVHWMALRWLPEVEVVAVVSRTRERAEDFSIRHGIPHFYTDEKQLYRDHPELQAVHICNSNSAHLDSVRRALDAGVSVLCEKPLGTSSRQIQEMIARARQSKSASQAVCFPYRLSPTFQQLQNWVSRLGTLRSIRVSYEQSSWIRRQSESVSWMPDANTYGPSYVLADIGCHALDLLQSLAAASSSSLNLRVTSAVIDYAGKPGVCSDIAASVSLETPDGCVAQVEVTKASQRAQNHISIEIQGEQGKLRCENLFSEQIEFLGADGKQEIWERGQTDSVSSVYDAMAFPLAHPEGWLSGFSNLMDAFYEKNVLKVPGFEESLRVSEWIEDAQRMASYRDIRDRLTRESTR